MRKLGHGVTISPRNFYEWRVICLKSLSGTNKGIENLRETLHSSNAGIFNTKFDVTPCFSYLKIIIVIIIITTSMPMLIKTASMAGTLLEWGEFTTRNEIQFSFSISYFIVQQADYT